MGEIELQLCVSTLQHILCRLETIFDESVSIAKLRVTNASFNSTVSFIGPNFSVVGFSKGYLLIPLLKATEQKWFRKK